MKKLISWIRSRNRDKVIRNSFLLPILLVVAISISHVTTWYDIGNPIAWAIYLSIAIEVFALASVSAASIKMNRFSIWFLFSLVTSVQIIGNVFFTYNDISVTGSYFKSWVELIQPVFPEWSAIDHKRFLALIQGGLLPVMSLTALHYYIKFGDKADKEEKALEAKEPAVEKAEETLASVMADYKEDIEIKNPEPMPEPVVEQAEQAEQPQNEEVHTEPAVEDRTNETRTTGTPLGSTVLSDGRIQETFNFEKFFEEGKSQPETMTSKINNS
jgi:hypothetical protein